MKFLFASFIAVFFFASCSDNPRNTDSSNSDLRSTSNNNAGPDSATSEAPVAFADTVNRCYLWVRNKDTISMKVAQTGQAVNGQLTYNFYEKDDSHGIIDGIMVGDTLVADYTFKAEGTVSVRQAVFLKQGENFGLGSGDVKSEGSKEVFKDISKLKFDNVVLQRVSCTE